MTTTDHDTPVAERLSDAAIAHMGWEHGTTNAVFAVPESLEEALLSVVAERREQDMKWGIQHHPPAFWLSILVEEVGEAAHAVNNYGVPPFIPADAAHWRAQLRRELVQVAAVALAAIETLDTQEDHSDDES